VLGDTIPILCNDLSFLRACETGFTSEVDSEGGHDLLSGDPTGGAKTVVSPPASGLPESCAKMLFDKFCHDFAGAFGLGMSSGAKVILK